MAATSQFRGTLRQLVDPMNHIEEDHRSFIDRLGQEFCLECACNNLCNPGESQAVLCKMHICHCIDQITGAGVVAREDLAYTVIPSLVDCLASLGVDSVSAKGDSGRLSSSSKTEADQLRETLTLLILRLLSSLSSIEAASFSERVVHFITADGCGKQQALVALLARCAKAISNSSDAIININSAPLGGCAAVIVCVCRDHGQFLQRLLNSALSCPTPDHPLCDVLFLLASSASTALSSFVQRQCQLQEHTHQRGQYTQSSFSSGIGDSDNDEEEAASQLVVPQHSFHQRRRQEEPGNKSYGSLDELECSNDGSSEFAFGCKAAANCVVSSASSLVGHLEKFGHAGCWTNALALLATLASALETTLSSDNGALNETSLDDTARFQQGASGCGGSALLDDPRALSAAFEVLVLGSPNKAHGDMIGGLGSRSVASGGGGGGDSLRLGAAARALLVRSDCPAAVCGAAKLLCILSRGVGRDVSSDGGIERKATCSSSECTRVLLRDGVAEFAIAGLKTKGCLSSSSMRRALSELLDALSERDPIAFFHPSHFHPFALKALLDALDPNPQTSNKPSRKPGGRSMLPPGADGGGVSTLSEIDGGHAEPGGTGFKEDGSAIERARVILPLTRLLRRAVAHSSIVDHAGASSVAAVLARTVLSLTKNVIMSPRAYESSGASSSSSFDHDAAFTTNEALCEALQTWGKLLASSTTSHNHVGVDIGAAGSGDDVKPDSVSSESSATDPTIIFRNTSESSSSSLVHEVLSAVFSVIGACHGSDRTCAAAFVVATLWLGELPSSREGEGSADASKKIVQVGNAGWFEERERLSCIVFGEGSTLRLFESATGHASSRALALLVSVVLSGDNTGCQSMDDASSEFSSSFTRFLVDHGYILHLLASLSHATTKLSLASNHTGDDDADIDGASVFLNCLVAVTRPQVSPGWPMVDGFRALALECSLFSLPPEDNDCVESQHIGKRSDASSHMLVLKLINIVRDASSIHRDNSGGGRVGGFNTFSLVDGVTGKGSQDQDDDEQMGNAVEAAILSLSLSPAPLTTVLPELEASIASFIFSEFSELLPTARSNDQYHHSKPRNFPGGSRNRVRKQLPSASSLRAGVHILHLIGALSSIGADEELPPDNNQLEEEHSDHSSRKNRSHQQRQQKKQQQAIDGQGWVPSPELVHAIQFYLTPSLADLANIHTQRSDMGVSGEGRDFEFGGNGESAMKKFQRRSTLDALLRGPNPHLPLAVLMRVASRKFSSASPSELLRAQAQDNIEKAAETLLWEWCRGLFRRSNRAPEETGGASVSAEVERITSETGLLEAVGVVACEIALTLNWRTNNDEDKCNSSHGMGSVDINTVPREGYQRLTLERACLATALLRGLLKTASSTLNSPTSPPSSALLFELTMACELITCLIGPHGIGSIFENSDNCDDPSEGCRVQKDFLWNEECHHGLWPMSSEIEVNQVHELFAFCLRHTNDGGANLGGLAAAAARMTASLVLRQCIHASSVLKPRTKPMKKKREYDCSKSFVPLGDDSDDYEYEESGEDDNETNGETVFRPSAVVQCVPLLAAVACGDNLGGCRLESTSCSSKKSKSIKSVGGTSSSLSSISSPSSSSSSSSSEPSSGTCPRTACVSALNGVAVWASSQLASGCHDKQEEEQGEFETAQRTLQTLRTHAPHVGSLLSALLLPTKEARAIADSVHDMEDYTDFSAACMVFLLLTLDNVPEIGSSERKRGSLPPLPPISPAALLTLLDPFTFTSKNMSKVVAGVRRCSDWDGSQPSFSSFSVPPSSVAAGMNLVASSLHLTARLLYTDYVVSTNSSSLDLPTSSPSSPARERDYSDALGVWWWVGSRDRQRFECAAHHWALSSTQAVGEAAAALLLVLQYTAPKLTTTEINTPELNHTTLGIKKSHTPQIPSTALEMSVVEGALSHVSLFEGWHRLVVEEIIESLRPPPTQLDQQRHGALIDPPAGSRRSRESSSNSRRIALTSLNTSDVLLPGQSCGPFAILLLASTAELGSSIPWVVSVFKKLHQLPSLFSSAKSNDDRSSSFQMESLQDEYSKGSELMRIFSFLNSKSDGNGYSSQELGRMASFLHLSSVLRNSGFINTDATLETSFAALERKLSNEPEPNDWKSSWVSVTPALSVPVALDWATFGLTLPRSAPGSLIVHPSQLVL